MKILVARDGRVVVEEVPIPQVGNNEVLVANVYSVVSIGTEVSIIKSSKKRGILYLAYKAITDKELREKALGIVKGLGPRKALQIARQTSGATSSYGAYLGYSSVGYVISVGRDVKDINVGEIVACGGAEYAHHAEVVSVPRNLVAKVPPNVDLLEAAFTTIGSVALHALRLAEIQPGSFIAVIGTGLIGLIVILLAKNVFSSRVIAIDIDNSRLKLASELGADLVINVGSGASDDDVMKKVLEYTSGIGVDAAIVAAATRSSKPVNMALKLVRSRGRVVVVGNVGMNIDRNLMYLKEVTVIVSRSYGPGRYDPLYEKKGIDYPIDYVRWTLNRNMEAFLDFLAQKKISLKPLISKIVSIDEAPKIYEELLSGKANYIGVVIKYNYEKYIEASKENLKLESKIIVGAKVPLPKSSRFSKPIKVAVLGAGSFATQVLIPLIKELSEYYKLVAIVTRDPVECKEKAKRFKASYCSTDPLDVIYSNDVDMVVIATRHDTHAKFTIEAIKAGKAVFVEKPLALTEDELNEIVKVYVNNPVPITVDFNRRFSPYAIKARQIVEGQGPIFALYRVNAGMIPPTHWVQDPEVGGGRIIGEVCHFIDFFNYLLQGTNLNSIKVDFLPVDNKKVKALDNVAIQLKWDDGSLTTILYTSIGSIQLPKEYIEIHFNGSSIAIDDYKHMTIYRSNKKEVFKTKEQDKGHRNHLIEFAKYLLRDGISAIPSFEEYIKSMTRTFAVERLIKNYI